MSTISISSNFASHTKLTGCIASFDSKFLFRWGQTSEVNKGTDPTMEFPL
jgi:hypothetical protein